MYIDTHAHVNFNMFRNDADEVIRRSLSEDVWMVLVGSEYKTSRRALDYANKYEKGVYAAIGLHPTNLEDRVEENGGYEHRTTAEDFNYDMYEQLSKLEKVVAIGEIGLDYYHINKNDNVENIKEKQKDVLIQQLEMSARVRKPAIIHCRQAHDDMVELLTEFKKDYKSVLPVDKPWGVLHCFSGDEDLAWKYFSLGLHISFTGIITFSSQWDDLIRKIPRDRYMLETDCPYMTPEPYRGQRNEPMLVKYVAKRIADIKHIEVEKVEIVSTENARNFFSI